MDKLTGIMGLVLILGICYVMSNNRRAINWKTVGVGMAIQLALALLILKIPFTRDAFALMGKGVNNLIDYSKEGLIFIVGPKLAAEMGFIFVLHVGAAIIFVAALSSLLYYWGIMQKVVVGMAKALRRTMGITGPEATSTVAAMFVGQVECQVLIKPYLAKLTTSELFCSLSAAMATISGSALVAYTAMGMNPAYLIAASIMSAPAGIVCAKMMFPETEKHALEGDIKLGELHTGVNAFDALAVGTIDGMKIAVNVMIMVLVAVACVAMLNGILGGVLGLFGYAWTLQDLFGWVCFPLALLMGVPWDEAFNVGRLIATGIVVNEFVGYAELGKVAAGTGPYVLAEKSQLIAAMALSGFANFGSIAINIGGLGAMVPERRSEIAQIGMKAMFAANFSSWMTAVLAGLLF